MMQRVLILGATSAIAEQTARLYAKRNAHLFLVGRDTDKLAVLKDDLQTRGAETVDTYVADLSDTDRHEELLKAVYAVFKQIDITLIAYAILGDQKKEEASFETTLASLTTNFTSVISLLTRLAPTYEKQQCGTIAAISSVAGDRGRQSNYVYGTAKGGLSIFLQGLRNRLQKANVHILTIKPGFVDTPMTTDFNKGLLWVSPETIAKGIVRGIDKRKDVIFLPWFWRWIMLIIKMIPERIFKKMSL